MPNVMDELTSENLKQVREAHRDSGRHHASSNSPHAATPPPHKQLETFMLFFKKKRELHLAHLMADFDDTKQDRCVRRRVA
jgi:hypothetical protein